MADDTRDTAAAEEQSAQQPEIGRETVEDTREAGVTEEVRESIAEDVEERVEDEEKGRGRAFSKDQIIHEAAIKARGLYGSNRPSLKMETYGERPSEAGYYDLVDCWLVVAHMLNGKYHETFRKRATPFPWAARTNRYLIPNFYVFAMKGVDRAINEEYISPLFSDKLEYRLGAHTSLPFIVAGPPLAYFDWSPLGPSKEEARAYAGIEEEGIGAPDIEEAKQDLEFYKRRVYELGNTVERHEEKIEDLDRIIASIDSELDDVPPGSDEEAELEDRLDELEERRDTITEDMEDAMEKLESAYAKYEELAEETP
ncbi:MAG: hypothetical protein ABEI97_02655 [Candidatus Nanohaloarchaea archaeon]